MNSKILGDEVQTDETVEARVEHAFRASPERVFDAWLEPDLVTKWMRAALRQLDLSGDVRRVEIDPRVGGRFTFSDMRDDGEAVHWGTYLEIDRPRRLVFTWITSEKQEQENSSVVTLTIEPDGDGCLASIVHTLDAKYAQFLGQTEEGWACMLGQIVEAVN